MPAMSSRAASLVSAPSSRLGRSVTARSCRLARDAPPPSIQRSMPSSCISTLAAPQPVPRRPMSPVALPSLLNLGRQSLGFHTSRSVRAAPPPTRDPQYATLTPADISAFASMLSTPSTQLLTTLKPERSVEASLVEESELEAFNEDWMGKYKGRSACVLKPRTTDEVAKILRYCHERRLAVVPQGGNTGLVGGSTPVFDEIVLSLSNMNKVHSFDEVSGALVADAGCILESLDNYLAERGYIIPLDLGAKGSCHIGGNVATNAGGLRLLRYGSLHGSVLGLEVVLPDGTVMDNLTTLRKDNTGFDLKQLFIGSEGTIGVITKVAIAASRRPSATNVAVFALESYDAVQKAFAKCKAHCGEILSAFEFFDEHAFDCVQKHATSRPKDPFEARHPFYVLVETSGSKAEHDEEKLQGLLEDLMESGTISDGVLAQGASQQASLWSLRESIPEAAGKMGSVYKYDLSMKVEVMNTLVEDMRSRFRDRGMLNQGVGVREGEEGFDIRSVVGYGHIGDGNLHINIVASRFDKKIEGVIEPYIFEWVSKKRGSISAEHGLGLQKAPYIGYSKDAVSIEYMKRIKKLFDPRSILNPYKYIRTSTESSPDVA